MNQETKPGQPEIKAGQVWVFKEWPHCPNKSEFTVVCVGGGWVLFDSTGIKFYDTITEFLRLYKLKPTPKTRPITWDDARKLLREHGVVYYKNPLESYWILSTCPQALRENSYLTMLQFSPNPFAPNPIIIGPLVDVVEGDKSCIYCSKTTKCDCVMEGEG